MCIFVNIHTYWHTYWFTHIETYIHICVYIYVYIYICTCIYLHICICIFNYIYIYIYICLPPLKPTGFDLFIVFYVDFLLFVAFKSRQRFPLIWRLWMFECDESCFMYRYNDILWGYLQCFRLLYCVPCASMSQWVGFRLDFWSLVCLCMFLMFVSLIYFEPWGEHDPTGAMYDMNFMVHLGHLALRSPRQHYPCPICRRHLRAGAPE